MNSFHIAFFEGSFLTAELGEVILTMPNCDGMSFTTEA
jgi:hypothetical protein